MGLQRATWDAVIVGGGVVGCAVARALAARGRRVLVLERGRPCSEASWAAAGMLSPLGEALEPGPFLALALDSMARWPAFAAELEEESGTSVGFRACGKLLLAFDDAGRAALRERRRWQEAEGFEVAWLEGDGVREVEPAASRAAAAALHLPRDGQVDNRALGEALWRAAEARGCRFALGETVASLVTDGTRTAGVRTAGGTTVEAGAVVVAAGAWSGGLAGLPRPVPVRPVRGQMLALRADRPLLRGVVAAPGAYLIPREDGPASTRVLVGATMEEAGFARGTTPDAVAALRDAAVRAVPTLADAEVVETWGGLRPGTPDDLPVLGPDPGIAGLHWATGHFRNGILLAPATGVRVAEGVVGAAGPDAFDGFAPDRFPAAAGRRA